MDNFDPIGGGYIFQNFFDYIFNTLLGVPVEEVVFRLKIISFFFCAVFLIGIIWVVIKLNTFRIRFHLPARGLAGSTKDKLLETNWNNIMKRFGTGTDADATLAIIEADNLADDLLKRMGISGDAMMERIEQLNPLEVVSLPGLKEAHRVRNNIAHTPGFKISKEVAKALLEKYEKFFKELEVI